jgi:hypothetical protein
MFEPDVSAFVKGSSPCVMILSILTPITKQPDSSGEYRVVGSDESSLAVRSEVLARIKAEAADVGKSGGASSLVFGAMSLCRILNHRDAVAAARCRESNPCPQADRTSGLA